MKHRQRLAARALGRGLAGCIVVAGLPAIAVAEEGGEAPMTSMRQQIEAQNRQIDALKADLARQEAALAELRSALGMRGRGPAPAEAAAPAAAPGPAARPAVVAQQGQPAQGGEQTVGQAPAGDNRPQRDVVTIFETPGVLTPPGKWIVEPSLQYAYSSSNRVALVGYTVIPAILIGLIDVREVKRNTFTAALTVRRGITNRFELEAKVPWVYRSDTSVSREYLVPQATESVFDADGKGIGDIELTGRYQLNDGGGENPYYIASLRFKTRTGKDPFEVETNYTLPGGRGTGLQTELPTGSGFYTLTPGLTVLIPSDPAVFFGGLSYQYSFKRDNVKANTVGGPSDGGRIGDVEPGGVIGFNFGMGLALNERSSFSLGYDHQSVGKVKIDGRTAPGSVRVQLGTLLMGYSYRLNSGNYMNLSLGVGVTRDTPDLQLTLRMPMSL